MKYGRDQRHVYVVERNEVKDIKDFSMTETNFGVR